MVFRKAKMLERLHGQGLTDEDIKKTCSYAFEMMDAMDGKEASANCWRRVVFDEPVLYVEAELPNGESGAYVAEEDCE